MNQPRKTPTKSDQPVIFEPIPKNLKVMYGIIFALFVLALIETLWGIPFFDTLNRYFLRFQDAYIKLLQNFFPNTRTAEIKKYVLLFTVINTGILCIYYGLIKKYNQTNFTPAEVNDLLKTTPPFKLDFFLHEQNTRYGLVATLIKMALEDKIQIKIFPDKKIELTQINTKHISEIETTTLNFLWLSKKQNVVTINQETTALDILTTLSNPTAEPVKGARFSYLFSTLERYFKKEQKKQVRPETPLTRNLKRHKNITLSDFSLPKPLLISTVLSFIVFPKFMVFIAVGITMVAMSRKFISEHFGQQLKNKITEHINTQPINSVENTLYGAILSQQTLNLAQKLKHQTVPPHRNLVSNTPTPLITQIQQIEDILMPSNFLDTDLTDL